MKRLFFIFISIISLLPTFSQTEARTPPFAVYKPIGQVRGNYNKRMQPIITPKTYYVPSRPKSNFIRTTGYYMDSNKKGWYKVSIKINPITENVQTGEQIYLRAVADKIGRGWSECNTIASEVSMYDEETIRENFNWKVYHPLYGQIYFSW